MTPRNKETSLWSVRMRASGKAGEHISGAEGLFPRTRIESAMHDFARRALAHPRGKPAHIIITIELLRKAPRALTALPVRTLSCKNPIEADASIRQLLLAQDKVIISGKALRAALWVVRGDRQMRGAALICAKSGRRLDTDRRRGVRASMLGISAGARATLLRRLKALGPLAETAAEAITLATKVASAPNVIAELCISDDPDYTTGYFASRKAGYIRIPNIKRVGSTSGGRVFFISPPADPKRTMEYLENTPVLVSRIARVSLRQASLNGSHK